MYIDIFPVMKLIYLKSEKGIKIFGVKMKTLVLLLVKEFNPDIIYVSGWTNKKYKIISKYFMNNNIPTILGMDNQWKAIFINI